ncbi:MAG: hypothetical protein WCT44_02260 [Candidatus Paceibacterota bacterium]
MKSNFKIIVLVFIIIVIAIFVYLINSRDVVEELPLAGTETSIKGCYVAHLEKDIYTLVIQSEKDGAVTGALAYNNYQKDSSSGSFTGTFKDNILLGIYSFDSEGMHSNSQVIFKKVGDSFMQGFGTVKVVGDTSSIDPISSVEYNPKSTFIKSENCLEKITDSNNILTFDYNPFFKYVEGNNSPSFDWRLDSREPGAILASVIIPRTYLPGTNFSDAKLTVGRATTPSAIKGCSTDVVNGEAKIGEVQISDYPFTKFSSNGAAAGNFYETTSYRGIVDGDCYAVEYTIHSTNINNYSPDQNIKEFNKTFIQDELEKIIQSLKFLINSD